MPAIMTHDFFGRDVLDAYAQMDSATIGERDAFLLGNQGPDPLFYLAAHPSKGAERKLGSTMHHDQPTELLYALSQSLNILDEHEQAIGRAYAQGFLCHYTLDSSMHPLVYATQFAIADAGIEGLSRKHCHEIHAEVERELDEMVLFKKRQQTIAQYSPADNILEASEEVLAIIQKIYAYLALTVYGKIIDANLFPSAVHCFRSVQRVFYSPRGIKRTLLGRTERLLREHSFLAAMAHRNEEVDSSWYANPSHNAWTNPFTDELHSESFWDIYNSALELAAHNIELFEQDAFTIEDAREITHELNFSGEPVVATLVIEG